MNEFIVVAYADPEYGLPKQEKTIIAATLESAKDTSRFISFIPLATAAPRHRPTIQKASPKGYLR